MKPARHAVYEVLAPANEAFGSRCRGLVETNAEHVDELLIVKAFPAADIRPI